MLVRAQSNQLIFSTRTRARAQTQCSLVQPANTSRFMVLKCARNCFERIDSTFNKLVEPSPFDTTREEGPSATDASCLATDNRAHAFAARKTSKQDGCCSEILDVHTNEVGTCSKETSPISISIRDHKVHSNEPNVRFGAAIGSEKAKNGNAAVETLESARHHKCARAYSAYEHDLGSCHTQICEGILVVF